MYISAYQMGMWRIERIHIFIGNVKHSKRLFNYTTLDYALQKTQKQRKSDCGRREAEKIETLAKLLDKF